MIKIFKKEEVYIPVSEIRDLGINVKFPPYMVEIHPTYGAMIKESDFNTILLSDEKLLEKNGGHPELTKVSSYACKVENIKSLAPLKYMFLSHMHIGEDEAIEKIQREDSEEFRKELVKICLPEPEFAENYKKHVSMIRDNQKYIEDKLGACGLKLQCLTEINGNKIPGLTCFVAGVNLFYQLYIHDWSQEDFERFERKEDGTLVIPEPEEYEDAEFIPESVTGEDRDFREYSVRENLAWCLQNMPLKNEFQDELNCHMGGIYFYANIRLVTKMFNTAAFPETLFFDGMIDYEESTIIPEKPAGME